jgi:protein-S-isoprenylcysteine O-methyltransferase Ste14
MYVTLSGNPFPSVLAAEAFAFSLFVWLASEFIGAWLIPAMRRRGTRVERRNVGSNTLVLFSWVVLFSVAVGFAGERVLMLPEWVSCAGSALMLVGVAIRQWSIAVLGRFFSGVIGVQSEQKVVEKGPYRLVRHPSYTGVLLIQLGICLALGSLASVPVAILLFALGYGYRIHVEEKVLVSELGSGYVDYMKRTKRVIPFLV